MLTTAFVISPYTLQQHGAFDAWNELTACVDKQAAAVPEMGGSRQISLSGARGSEQSFREDYGIPVEITFYLSKNGKRMGSIWIARLYVNPETEEAKGLIDTTPPNIYLPKMVGTIDEVVQSLAAAMIDVLWKQPSFEIDST